MRWHGSCCGATVLLFRVHFRVHFRLLWPYIGRIFSPGFRDNLRHDQISQSGRFPKKSGNLFHIAQLICLRQVGIYSSHGSGIGPAADSHGGLLGQSAVIREAGETVAKAVDAHGREPVFAAERADLLIGRAGVTGKHLPLRLPCGRQTFG